jgi:hypothetical protein
VPAEAGHDAVGGPGVLDLAIVRLPGWYGAPAGLAITPSSPAPSKRRTSRRAAPVLRHRREVDRRRGAREQRARAGPAARRCGRSRRSSSPAASRSKATNEAGDCLAASRATRDAAGCRRSWSASKSSPPGPGDHDLAVEHAARRAAAPAARSSQLGEVAVERLEVAALDVDVAAVAEDERAEAVPLRLVDPAVAVGRQVSGVSFASIGSIGGAIARSAAAP